MWGWHLEVYPARSRNEGPGGTISTQASPPLRQDRAPQCPADWTADPVRYLVALRLCATPPGITRPSHFPLLCAPACSQGYAQRENCELSDDPSDCSGECVPNEPCPRSANCYGSARYNCDQRTEYWLGCYFYTEISATSWNRNNAPPCPAGSVIIRNATAATFPVCSTDAPTATPTAIPTLNPTVNPTVNPTAHPTANPTTIPTANPTANPTVPPTANPTTNPTVNPTVNPTLSGNCPPLSLEPCGYPGGPRPSYSWQ